MTVSLSPHRLRLKLDMATHAPAVDLLTESAPVIWRGTDVQIEVGLYKSKAFVDTVSNIAQLALEIHAMPRSSDPLVQIIVAPTVIQETAWIAGTAQTATFALTHLQTQFDFTDAREDKKTYWLVVYAITNDATPLWLTCGCAQLSVEEDGACNGGLVPIPSAHPPYVEGDNLYIWNADQSKYQALKISGQAAQETVDIANP